MTSIKRVTAWAGYPVPMKPWQVDQLRRALEQRRETLLEELKRDAARLREERSADIDDEAVVDLLVDLDQADLSRPAAARCVECQTRHEKTYRR